MTSIHENHVNRNSSAAKHAACAALSFDNAVSAIILRYAGNSDENIIRKLHTNQVCLNEVFCGAVHPTALSEAQWLLSA